MVHAGKKSYVYWKTEDSWAYDQAMGANAAGNKHTPFNPLLKFVPPTLTYKEEVIRFFSSLEPSVVYTTQWDPQETDNEAIYMDPIMMLNIFTNKIVPGTWANTVCNIEGLFTTQSDISSLAVHYLLFDQSGSGAHVDRTLKGVKITQWGLKCEKGKLLKEVWKWKAAALSDETQAPDIDDNFDGGEFNRTGVDGGFASWDSQGPFHSTDMTVTWDSSAIGGMDIENWDISVEIPEEFIHIYSNRAPQSRLAGVRNFVFNASGLITTEAQLDELEKTHANKTKATLKIQIGARSDYYIQFTNAYVSKFEFDGIPEAGAPSKCSITLSGGASTACSFKWEGKVSQDPSAHIVHAP